METLYVSDLDGTLLGRDAILSPGTLGILNSLISRGLPFTFATARSFSTAHPAVEGLELRLPVITYNGVFLVDPATAQPLQTCTLDPAKLGPTLELLERSGASMLVYSLLEGRERVSWITGSESPGVGNYIKERHGNPRLRGVSTFRDLLSGEIFYITLIGERLHMEELGQSLTGIPYLNVSLIQDIYRPQEWWLELYRADATKAQAVTRLKERVGAKRVVCFGDNRNDLSMFRAADAGYAVGNAVPELKKLAAGIIGHHHQDGVALWLRENWRK